MNYTPVHSYNCKQESWQLCLGCGAKVCACHGLTRGTCPFCYRGLLTNYVKSNATCSYKNCNKPAVADGIRGKRYVCAEHGEQQGYSPGQIEGDGKGQMTWRVSMIANERGITIPE